ncbi:MAG TPA: aspartate kinase [Steroidobacteraceae bacterium]|jgi:aspartate kinase|nr:aspartate kinase [Steroidobacteraceae bacterium]
MALIVQKYGGTSVGSVARIHAVASKVHALAREGHRVAVVVSAMGDSTDRLIELAREVCAEPDARELDALLATGEMVSTALLAMALRKAGCGARSYNALQLPIDTTGPAGRARIERVGCESLKKDIDEGVVPVVAGFQGRAANGDLTTIGRGGSDTTAVALAVALKADECQILTDVDGVYTTDPRMVPEARRLPTVSFEEMLELAGQGSRVLHLRSVEFAARHGMRLRVLSSFEPGPGTLISEENPNVEAPVVSGIAFNRDEAAIAVTQVPHEAGVAYALIAPVAEASIEVDMIVINAPREARVDLTFTVHRDDYARALEVTRKAAARYAGAAVAGDDRVAKLAIVGSGMRSHAGVAAKLFATLGREGINVRLVSTSEIKVSVLVAEQDLERAVHALHRAFALDRPPSP